MEPKVGDMVEVSIIFRDDKEIGIITSIDWTHLFPYNVLVWSDTTNDFYTIGLLDEKEFKLI